jgi:hypothetical protein
MEKLRDETRIGWLPNPETTALLEKLYEDDERFAARDMPEAHRILDMAEADVIATKPHRMARIERAKERIAALEKAYVGGWKPNEGLKWPHPNVVAWCGMFSGARFWNLDELDQVINYFEERLAAEPATEAQLVEFDKRLSVLRERYRFGWRPFGSDPFASWAANKLDVWCTRPKGKRPADWDGQTATQIDIWLTHFEQAGAVPGLNASLKLGPTLLGKKGFRK